MLLIGDDVTVFLTTKVYNVFLIEDNVHNIVFQVVISLTLPALKLSIKNEIELAFYFSQHIIMSMIIIIKLIGLPFN